MLLSFEVHLKFACDILLLIFCIAQDGDRFWKLPECYIRGNSIKYLRIPDEIIDLVSEEEQRDRKCICRNNFVLTKF